MALDTQTCERARRIPVAVLHDVLVKAGRPDQVLHHSLRSFDGLPPFAGPAFCVQGQPVDKAAPKPRDVRFDLYRELPPGAVLVMSAGGYELTAILGENMCSALLKAGCCAVVMDGGYRDRLSIAELGLPVRAAFVSPVASSGRFALVALQQPLRLRGQTVPEVTVHPNDLLVGDDEGVVVIPAHGIGTVLEDAEQVLAIEAQTRELINGGLDAEQAYARFDRFGHVRKL